MTKYATSFNDAIWCKEVLMSRKIIDNGWNISSLLPLYQNVDFTFTPFYISNAELYILI